MDSIFSDEPVSSNVVAFRRAAKSALLQNDPLVILFRYAYSAGAKDYFIARSIAEFDRIMDGATAKTSITVFFSSNFIFDGIVDVDTGRRLNDALPTLYVENEGIDIVCVDTNDVCLDNDNYIYLKNANQINDWIAKNQGRRILAGMLAFWLDNCDNVITVYVPDDDGVVRPGAY